MRLILAISAVALLALTLAGRAAAEEAAPDRVAVNGPLERATALANTDSSEPTVGAAGLGAASKSLPEPGLILFESSSGGACVPDCLYTMRPDGSEWNLVTSDTLRSWTWSPFGTYVAFEENLHVKIMKADGTSRAILASGFSVNGISWSPDGWTLAFSGRLLQDPSNTQDLYLVNRDGSDLRKIVDLAVDVNYPSWSPDGTKLAFSSVGVEYSDIFVVNADGTGRTNLTKSADREDTRPNWSPLGDQIVFEGTDHSGFADPDIYVVDTAGGPAAKLTDSPVDEGAPVWSPDGAQIAFHGYDGSELNIYRMDADGSNVTPLTVNGASDVFPVWAPKRSGMIQGGIFNNQGQTVDQGHVDLWTKEGAYVDTYAANASAIFETDTLPNGDYLALMWNGDNLFFIDYFPKWYANAPLLRSDRATVITVNNNNPDVVEVVLDPLFFDMFDSTFENDIAWMQYAGVTRGCNPPSNDRYCPDDFVTRGAMAAFLVRALGYTDNGGGDLFTDDDGHTFENDIDKLGTAGVTKGCNPPVNDKFCPDDLVTRGQMAAFLVRALGYTDNGGGDLFTDDDGSIFENDIDKLGTAGVTKGCNPPVNDRFCANDFVTRGQMAAFLRRALG